MSTKPFEKSRTFLSKKYSPSTETTASPYSMEIIGEELNLLSHPQHSLMHVRSPHLYSCMGCKEYGAGKRFQCKNCDFVLHEFCALAPPSLNSHPLHTQHQLVFYAKPGGRLRLNCDNCDKATRGYAFRCSTCNFEIHPCCSKLLRAMEFPVHPHTLNLSQGTANDSGSACSECKRKRSGRVYRCTVCDYCIHAVCAKDMVNGLHENGIKAPQNPSMIGVAVRLASDVVKGFIGGLIEGIGEGVGEVFAENILKNKPSSSSTTNDKPAYDEII